MKMGTADQMVKIHRLAMENQKKALIDKACKWLKFNTNWDDEFDDMGRNLNYGMIEEFRKAMLKEE